MSISGNPNAVTQPMPQPGMVNPMSRNMPGAPTIGAQPQPYGLPGGLTGTQPMPQPGMITPMGQNMTGAPNVGNQPQPYTLPPGATGTQPQPQPGMGGIGTQPMPQPGMGQPNVYQKSSGAYNAALGGTAGAMGMPNVGAFANPYQTEVINRSMGDINRQQEQSLNQLGAQASAAGSFGGSRHGVAEAQTREGYARQAGDLSANLRNQGFNTALGAAQQQQQQQLAGAGQMGNLANLGFGFGQQLTQNQMQQGALQQALNQALIDAGKGQYSGFTGAPNQALNLPLAALGASQMGQQSTTESKSPGLLSIFSSLLGLG